MGSSAADRSPRKRPVEYSILYTATLCLLAGGAVMVYAASAAESLLSGTGDASYYLKRYLMFGLIGLAVMHLASRHGRAAIRAITPVFLVASFFLTILVMLPGFGVTVNGATRWLGFGPLQFQPSEMLKVALIFYAAQVLAARPRATKTLGGLVKPLLIVVGVACLLLLEQPDMGTAMTICFALGAPYRRERLTSFLDPFSDAGDSGFQAVQALTAIGSGGFFGVGLGESVQKIFYLPEAHTDMILAIIGEELGLIGLYGMIAYAGLRAAKLARDLHSKLLAAGVTSLILCQATLNFFAVLGMAPLTGVPLPFLSYGSTNLIVLMGAMGLLLDVAATGGRRRGRRLQAIDGGRDGHDRDRRGRDGRARRAGAGGR